MAKSPKPTDGELAILRVLWLRGPSTVREIQNTMNAAKPTGYTTVLKLLQIMADKGLVDRDESVYAHVYKARCPQAQTQQTLVADLLDRAFDGSAGRMVVQALAAQKAGPEELAEIRRLLKDYERGVK
jgi:predicted transcriptional regulator